MFTVIKWFFRLPWFLWLAACGACLYFGWQQFEARNDTLAAHEAARAIAFEAPSQTVGSFRSAALGPQGEVTLTAQIDWTEYYELSDTSRLIPVPTYGYMLFRPNASGTGRIMEGFAYFPFYEETPANDYIDDQITQNLTGGAIADLGGRAQVGHAGLEAELRDAAAMWDIEVADSIVFLDLWPEGAATTTSRQMIETTILLGACALGAFVTFILMIISLVARLLFGRKTKLDPTQLQEAQPDTPQRKLKRAGMAFGAAKSAGDFMFGDDEDAGGIPSSGAMDIGIMDEVSDFLGPFGFLFKLLGKQEKRSLPMPKALDPISQRKMGKVSARTARLMQVGGGDFIPEPGPPEDATDIPPQPPKPTLSFKDKMRADPFARLQHV